MPGAAPPWQLTMCQICHRCLVHPPGSTLLLCPACRGLLNLSGLPSLSTAAQTACISCRTVMMHPLGTRIVVCPLCAAHTPAALSFYVCPGCALYLVYSSTLSAVVCAVCHTVEPPIDRPPNGLPSLMPLNRNDPPRPMPRLPPRRIPWLPSTPVRPVSAPRPLQMPRPVPENGARVRRPARPHSIPVQGIQTYTEEAATAQDTVNNHAPSEPDRSGIPPHPPIEKVQKEDLSSRNENERNEGRT